MNIQLLLCKQQHQNASQACEFVELHTLKPNRWSTVYYSAVVLPFQCRFNIIWLTPDVLLLHGRLLIVLLYLMWYDKMCASLELQLTSKQEMQVFLGQARRLLKPTRVIPKGCWHNFAFAFLQSKYTFLYSTCTTNSCFSSVMHCCKAWASEMHWWLHAYLITEETRS